MKFKKLFLGITLSLLVFSLVACGSDPRKEFVEAMYSTDMSDYNAAKFDMKIKDLTYNGDQGNATVRMVANQLKDMKIDGTYAFDEKAEAAEMEVNLNLLGEKIPLQLVGKKDTFYMSTSFVSGLADLATAFGTPIELDKNDLAKLKDKYIDIAETGSTLSSEKSDAEKNSFKEAFSVDTKKNKKYNDDLKKLVESFDKNSFKKDKDTLSHTFTKEEFIKIIDFMNKNLKEDKKAKKAGLDKQLTETTQALKKDIDKLEMNVSINEKTKKTDLEVTFGMKNPENKNNNMSIVLALSMTPQKNKNQIKLPDKKNIITQNELTKIMNEISGATTSDVNDTKETSELDYSNDEEVQALIEEQLDTIIEEINNNAGNLDAAKAEQIRKNFEPVLNAEQMKKINEALDKALLK